MCCRLELSPFPWDFPAFSFLPLGFVFGMDGSGLFPVVIVFM
jgi:hypothetical protein